MFPDAVGGILVMLGLLAESRNLLMITVICFVSECGGIILYS